MVLFGVLKRGPWSQPIKGFAAICSQQWLHRLWLHFPVSLYLVRGIIIKENDNLYWRDVLHSISGQGKNTGCQCDVRVPSRWRLSLLLLWLLRWHTTAEMHGALQGLTGNRVHNGRCMSRRTRLPTRWWLRGRHWWPLLSKCAILTMATSQQR